MFYALPVMLAFVQDADQAPAAKKGVEVTAQLIVAKKPSLTKQAPNPALVEDYTATFVAVLGSNHIAAMAVRSAQLKPKLFAKVADPVAHILDRLNLERDAKTNIITLTYSAADANEGVAVLNSIMDSFRDYLDSKNVNAADQQYVLLIKARDMLEKDLDQAHADLVAFRAVSQSAGKNAGAVIQNRIMGIEAKIGDLELKQAEIEGRLAWVELARNDDTRRIALQVKANEWSARSGFDKLKGKDGDSVAAYAEYLKAEREELALVERALKQSLATAIALARQHAETQVRDDRLRQKIAGYQNLYNEIAVRLRQAETNRDTPAFEVIVLRPPREKPRAGRP